MLLVLLTGPCVFDSPVQSQFADEHSSERFNHTSILRFAVELL